MDDCKRMAYLFPMHQAFDDKHNQRKEPHSPIVPHDKFKRLEQVRKILDHMAYKRMAKINQRSRYSVKALTSTHTMNILQLQKRACIKVKSKGKCVTKCIDYILKHVRDARAVLIS